ncbi:MAG TPA: hypothetical protein VKG82_00100 [Solirubrobacteraceae bacterium]|nr:hypothetical protein [Solirubrobacteraceae bacterium]
MGVLNHNRLDHDDHDVVLTCALHCATAREAVSVAGELRELPGVRVSVQSSPLKRSSAAGWLLQLTTEPLALSATEIAQRQSAIDETVEQRAGTWFLGWRVHSAPEQRAVRRVETSLHPALATIRSSQQAPAHEAAGRSSAARARRGDTAHAVATAASHPHERTSGASTATPACPSQRETVIASLLRRPAEDAA